MEGRVIGNTYLVLEHIGFGSFADVWKCRHIQLGHEVAIKEVRPQKLAPNPKLRESLISEISILKQIRHPNITHLHRIIQEKDRIFLILEYCNGGDLGTYIQKHGRVPKDICKSFMIQLADGLKVIREKNLIHRDLKPQNLLLSNVEGRTILKIADFGFARSLQEVDMAETLCGSPLYMAPEVMQGRKYDAKADLWSVGAILFQLVTGSPPFIAVSQHELLTKIISSGELQFPSDIVKDIHPDSIDLCKKLLRKNPVERISFEEFFSHKFVDKRRSVSIPEIAVVSSDCSGFQGARTNEKLHNFSQLLPPKGDTCTSTSPCSTDTDPSIKIDPDKTLSASDEISSRNVEFAAKDTNKNTCKRGPEKMPHLNNGDDVERERSTKPAPTIADSLEGIENEYVIVSRMSSHTSTGTGIELEYSGNNKVPTPNLSVGLESSSMLPLDRPSDDLSTRVHCLKQYAHNIAEMAKQKIESGKLLEAFSLQLVCLAAWKQALHVSYAWASCFTESSVSKEHVCSQEGPNEADIQQAVEACSEVEREFVTAVEFSEEFTSNFVDSDGNDEMPDAIELIYQESLELGRKAAMNDFYGSLEDASELYSKASELYSKATTLLTFLLVEAPTLEMNPHFSVTDSQKQQILQLIRVIDCQNQDVKDRISSKM